MTTVQTPADRLSSAAALSGISSKLQKNLFFLVLEIARLIADDLSNKQIAARLFLSERTVEAHVTNILNRLGLNSRVQISRWIDGL